MTPPTSWPVNWPPLSRRVRRKAALRDWVRGSTSTVGPVAGALRRARIRNELAIFTKVCASSELVREGLDALHDQPA